MPKSADQDATSRVKTSGKRAKGRGAAITPISRKAPVAKKPQDAAAQRKSASVNPGKRLPPAHSSRKS